MPLVMPRTFPRIWPVIGIAALSGFAGLGYEIIWTRVLANMLWHPRVLGNISINMIGRVKEKENYIVTRSEPVSGGWVKISPTAPLTPGEYAIVEVLVPKQLNMYVWDFGVDPSAPANPGAWKPEAPKDTQTGTSRSPVLEKRPK